MTGGSLPRQSERRIVDLFAGPGGWSEGLRMLGLSELGVEWDESACATARAAGHERLLADVTALEPTDYPCWGLIASPPCQAWSMAGKGGGRRDVGHVIDYLRTVAQGLGTKYRAHYARRCEDHRSLFVVEPLRWVEALEPEWIALEQVPPVLEMWELYADILRGWGYSVWTGVLEAERYGVPQTRERAVLMASKAHAAHPPEPTHQRYVPKEPQRHETTMFGEVLPWVSMAEALGWNDGALRTLGDNGSGGNKARPMSSPAPTVTSYDTAGGKWAWLRAGTNANDITRPADEPAPTLRFGARSNDVSWVHDRPSTTVNGDPRISEPGRHDPNESGSQQKNAVRVTVEEAAVLQSFRPDYPWQGTKTRQFEQVGNAVPPLLARAVLGELVDAQEMRDAA